MRRRTVVAALAQAPLLSAAAFAQSGRADAPPRVKTQTRDALGTTLVLGVPQAPFAGTGDDTVIVLVPTKYRFHEKGGRFAQLWASGGQREAATG